jgi:beta-1,2-mannobiose phosphorylase / 1,2-beta-oligomannan phosphorylase
LIPYRLTRLGMVMVPDPGDPLEAEGVLNPAAGHTPDGRLHLLPRVVAAGNVSRIGLATVVVDDGVPVAVERRGVVLEPEMTWERAESHGGVEDPRVTFIPRLGVHVMTYVAFGPLGPRIAVAVSDDLVAWRRLGPLLFAFEPEWDVDLNLYPNKDAVFFPEPVVGPDGEECYAMLHRPMWRADWLGLAGSLPSPTAIGDDRPGIWISYVRAADVDADVRAITVMHGHRVVAVGAHEFESAKIGAGPPPIPVPEGWLLIHHGVAGDLDVGFDPSAGHAAVYSAGAMLLDARDPSQILERTAHPLMQPETPEELVGTVSNVVFPTAIAGIAERQFVFYGMADARIGVAELTRR